ncbi:DNase I-like protein [Coniochaeta ligniaria NRRL 30616]|uniref:DNase I-like protein n=1 Tax=Coniochaeta ligniaria NRRL 30616 TaxID=1408157 RepID=A0A1J7IPE7_9PEZI|nr:DNase I-like protein [Coniochaeta ligniaria NRRL 30616]
MAASEEAATLTSSSALSSASTAIANDPVGPTSNPHSLHRAVAARRAEYVRPHRVRVKVGTWNAAACPGTDKDLARWFVDGNGVDPRLATLSPSLYKDSTVQGQETDATSDAESASVQLVGGDRIGLYVLGLQEAADLYGPGLYLRPYAGVEDAKEKWKKALQDALPVGYQLVSCSQLAGLVLLVYASPEIASTVSNVSSTTVGTGLMGLLGNKGAVATRIVLGETTRLVFVNCHLASGHDQVAADRRVWDAMAIQGRAKFEPICYAGVSEDEGDTIGDEDFAFWFGDLNFRLEGLPGDDIRRLLMLHTRGEYDVEVKGQESPPEGEGVVVHGSSDSSREGSEQGSAVAPPATTQHSFRHPSSSLPHPNEFDPNSDPHNDPASLQATLDSLLPHDQLRRVMRERKAFHDGWREGPITFLPSYKYDVGTVSLFDSSEKQRAPSWCDRVLYRTRTDREHYEQRVKDEEEARKRDEEMKARGMEHAGDDDQVLFDYDPDNDGDDQTGEQAGLDYDDYDEEGDTGEQVTTKDGALDRLHLDIYTSHQRITSSDHKPIVSIFTLDYDAVVPDLKAKVHAEVARELDRAENEGRPGITIVIDGHETRRREHASHPDLSEHAVDLGEIRFRVQQEASVTLANTGRVPASFSFVNSPTTNEDEEKRSIFPLATAFVHSDSSSEETELGDEVTLEPGETVKAVLKVFICDISQARMLNEGGIRLEDVLILRVKGGRDYFIPVRAVWSPTCIGRSLDELIRVPDGGLRAFAKSRLNEADGRTGAIPYELPVHFAAPKELFKLTEALESLTERALADEQMLEECKIPDDAGWPFEEMTWRQTDVSVRRKLLTAVLDALDTDTPISAALPPETPSLERLEVVSEVLLLFLESLADGIVSMPLWARIEQASLAILGQAKVPATMPTADRILEDDKAAVLEVLSTSPNHNISFVFLMTTLAKIISELAPLSKAAVEALRTPVTTAPLGRRSLSFRRNVATPPAEAVAAMQKRQAKERRFAEIFARVVCRTPLPTKDKERRSLEDHQQAVIGLFLKPRDDV